MTIRRRDFLRLSGTAALASGLPHVARELTCPLDSSLAQSGDEQVQRLRFQALFHRHHQPVFPDRKSDTRCGNF